MRGMIGAEVRVARVARLRPLVVVVQRRRRDVVRAAPEHELLLAELLEGLLLVLALQRAVVPLVEPPRPLAPGSSAGRRRRARGSAVVIARRSSEVCTTSGSRPGSRQQLAAGLGLGAALVGQVDVDPAGEEVLRVPVALAVAEQHQGRHVMACPEASRCRTALLRRARSHGVLEQADGRPRGCGSTRRARRASAHSRLHRPRKPRSSELVEHPVRVASSTRRAAGRSRPA